MDESTSVMLIQALANVWAAIRRNHPDVPEVVLLPAPAQHGKLNVLGHFAPLRWNAKHAAGQLMHEVVVVAEHLDRNAAEIVETLLHEAGHAICEARNVIHCSATSQYHNRNFRDAAVELGLDVMQVANYGFAFTTLPAATADRYADTINALAAVLVHRRKPSALSVAVPPGSNTGTITKGDKEEDAPAPPTGRLRKATCECDPPFIIRVAKTTMDNTTIRCDRCRKPFRLDA